MPTKPKSRANLPLYRLGFAPRTGVSANGQPTLGYSVEIGAVFARKEAEKKAHRKVFHHSGGPQGWRDASHARSDQIRT